MNLDGNSWKLNVRHEQTRSVYLPYSDCKEVRVTAVIRITMTPQGQLVTGLAVERDGLLVLLLVVQHVTQLHTHGP